MVRMLAILVLLVLPACAPVTIVESPWPAPPEWSGASDQHRRMGECLSSWLKAARPLTSFEDAARLAPDSGVTFVGESHDVPRIAHRLTSALRSRSGAPIWEEGIIWSHGTGSRLQGLYSRRWQGSETSGWSIIAGGDRFNRVFETRAATNLPANLIVYAGNAHVLHHPVLDGLVPRTGLPLPTDVAAKSGFRVAGFATYTHESLLGYLDLSMSVAILSALSNGRIDAAGAQRESQWCENFLAEARRDLAARGPVIIETVPQRYIISVPEGKPPWSIWTVASVRMLIEDPKVAALIAPGARVRLSQRATNNGIIGPSYEEFVFELASSPPRPAMTIVVTPRGVKERGSK